MIDHALKLAELGLRVFPLRPNSKKPPLIGDFPDRATTDAALLRKWWRKWPNANIGVATGVPLHGGYLVVLDVDVRPGKDGKLSLDLLYETMPSTLEVRTPNGGWHHYLIAPHVIPNDASRIAPGLDIRGCHGYVVGPGSAIDGKRYEIVE